MPTDFKALIEADTSEVDAKIKELCKDRKIKIGVEFDKSAEMQAKDLAKSIEKGLKSTKIDTSDLVKQIADGFNISDKNVIGNLKRQMDSLLTGLSKTWDGKKLDLSKATGFMDGLDKMAQTVSQNAKIVQDKMGIYDQFANYFKDKKIFVSDSLKSAMGQDLYKEISNANIGKIVRDATKGISIDSIWDEMTDLFPEHFSKDVTNQVDQIVRAFDVLKVARADVAKSISFADMTPDQQFKITGDVYENITATAHKMIESLKTNITSAADSLKTEFEIDVKVNTDNIISDVKNALSQAGAGSGEAVKINLDINQNEIETQIRNAIQSISSSDTPVDIKLDVSRQSLEADLQTALHDIDLPVQFRVDASDIENQIRAAVSAIDDIQIDVHVNVDNIREEINRGFNNNPIDLPIQPTNTNTSRGTGSDGETVFSALGGSVREAFMTFSLANLMEDGIYKTIDAGKQGIETVKSLDDAMLDLQMATGESKSNVQNMMQGYNALGQELGALTTEVSSSADTWLRQGRSIEETNQLIKDSMVLSKIGQIDSETSSEILTSTINGFQLLAEEASHVNDVLSSIDLASASSVEGIGTALTKTASIANNTGLSLEKTAAIIATIKDITQDSDDAIGNSVKSILSRMNNVKAGKFVDSETGEALNDVEKVLEKIGASMRDNNGQFRSSEEIIDNVAAKWKSLDKISQKAVVTAMGGTYQANRLTTLFDNYDKVQKLTAIANNSEGAAEAKFANYTESLEAKTKSLQASLEALASDTLSSEMYAGFLDAAKGMADFAKETDLVKTALAGLGTAGATYAFTQLSTMLSNTITQVANLGGGLRGLWGVLSAHPVALVTAGVTAAVGAWNMYQASVQSANEKMSESFSAYEQAQSDVESVNNELATTQARIDELNAKQSLTFVEQSELDKLQEANEKLQLQADLKKKQAEIAAKQAANDTITAYNKNYGKYNTSETKTSEYAQNADLTGNNAILFSNEKDISAMIAGIRQMQKLRQEALNSNDSEEVARYDETIQGATESIWGQVIALEDYKSKLEAVTENGGTLSKEGQDALNSINDTIEYVYKQLKPEKWNQMQFDNIFNQNRFSDAKESLKELASETGNIGISAEQVASKYPELVKEMEKAGFTAQDVANNINSELGLLNFDEVKKQLSEGFLPKGSDGDLGFQMLISKAQSEWDTFTKDMSQEDFEILYSIKQSNDTSGWNIDQWKVAFENAKNTAQTSADAISQSISEIINSDTISKAVSEYTSKISTLKDAQEEYNKTGKLSASTTKDLYENISDASDYSDDLAGSLDDMIKAADTDVMAAFNDEIEKLQKAGDYSGAEALRQYAQSVIESASEIEGAYQRIGKLKIETPQMQAVEEASSTDNGGKIYEDMRSQYKNIKDLYKNGLTGTDDFKSFAAMISPTGSDDVANFEENMGKFERYFTESSKGCRNFLADLKALGYAEQDGSKWTYNLGNNMMELKAAAEKMGIGFEPFMAMFGRLEDYGAYNDFFVTEEQGTQHLSDLYGDLAKEKMRLAEIEANPNTSGYETARQESLDKIAEYEERIAKTKETINNLDATNAEYMKEKAEYSKNVAQSMLDEINATSDTTLKQSLIDQLDAFAEEYHLKINYDTGSITNLEEAVENIDFKVNLDATGSDLDEQISGLSSYLAQLREGGEVGLNTSKISDAEALLSYLVEKKQQLEQPAVMGIDSSQLDNANDKMASAITAIQNFQTAYNQLQEAQALGLDTSEAEANIQNAKSELDSIDESTQKVLNFEVNGDDDVESIIDKIKNLDLSALDTSVQNLSYHFEIDNKDDLDAVVDKINNLPKDTQNVTVVLNTDQVDDTKLSNLTTALNSLPKGTESITVTLNMDEADTGKLEIINSGLSKISQTHPNTTVVVNGGEAVTVIENIQNKLIAVDATHPNPTISVSDQASSTISSVSSQLTNLNGKIAHTYVFTHHINSGNGKSEAQGNAKVHGNAKAQGNARAYGFKGEPKDTVALTGELKPELVVRGDEFFTVGDNGPEMVHLKKGDIVFDGDQTEDILTKGHTQRRGKAFARGNARVGGIDWGKSGNNGGTGSSSKENAKATQDNTNKTKENTKATEESTEAFDWVKTKLDKFAKAVETIGNKITDYISIPLKNLYLKRQINALSKEISANRTAYDTYMKQAESVDIPDNYKKLVQNGEFKVEEIDTSTDEGKKLAENIKKYEEYYNKALDCSDAIQELNNKHIELYETLVNLPIEQTEKKIEKLENRMKSLTSFMNTISSGGSAINALKNIVDADNPDIQKIQDAYKTTKATVESTQKTRVTTARAYKTAKADYMESGTALSQAVQKQTDSAAKTLKKATKNSTSKATYAAIVKAIKNSQPVSLKGLKGNDLKAAKAYNDSLEQEKYVVGRVALRQNVSTAGLSKDIKALAKDWNTDNKAMQSATKEYEKAVDANEKAKEDFAKAQTDKKSLDRSTTSEQRSLANLDTTKKSYVLQNKWLDEEIKILKDENKQYLSAVKQTTKTADKELANRDKKQKDLLNNKKFIKALTDDQLKALKNGEQMDLDGLVGDNVKIGEQWNKTVQKTTLALEAQTTAVQNLTESEATLAEKLVENEKKKLENISNYYDSMLSQFENRNSLIQTYMNRMETRGYNLSASFYEAQIANQKQIANQLKAELAAMQKAFQEALDNDRIQVGTQEYYEMQDAIQQVTMKIAETTNNIVDLQASIRDLEWEQFDRLQESIKRVASESDFLIELMSSKELYDKKTGLLTDEGWATMGLHGVNYNTYMAQADKYKEEMLKINAELASDPNNQKLIDRKNELIDAQQQSILAAENEKKAIRDMVEQGIDMELDAIDDLIDKYLDAIEAKKSLWEYEKKIQKQAEDIASLQKQLAAYQNDNSEEAKAKIQEIRVNLKEAQDNLKEAEYDKFISDQKELLESLRNDYEEVLNKRLDNIDVLIQTSIDQINANAENIQQTLTEQATSVGYELSEEMQTIWSSTEGVAGAIATYDGNFTTTMTGVSTALGQIYERQKSMIEAIDAMAEKYIQKVEDITKPQTPIGSVLEEVVEDNTDDDDSDVGNDSIINNSVIEKVEPSNPKNNSAGGATLSDDKKNNTSSGSNSNIWKGIAKDNSMKGNKSLDINTSIYDRIVYNGYKTGFASQKQLYTNLKGSGTYTGTAEQNTWMIKQLKLKGYASGGHVDKDQWAVMNENGQELIRYNGGFLVPLPESADIWNSPETKALLNEMSNPQPLFTDYTSQFMKSLQSVGGVNGSGQNIEYRFDNVTLNLPNVKNYPEFMNAMVKDKKFERLINAMTIDKVHGGSNHGKYKITWTE